MNAFVSTHDPILIVEDHADTADMLRRYLARKGYVAEVAPDGETALDLLTRVRPTCVILDETMPGRTGMEVLKEMKGMQGGEEVPVFFYSAAFDQGKEEEALALGARGWFVKGVSRLTDLMDRVMAAADGRGN